MSQHTFVNVLHWLLKIFLREIIPLIHEFVKELCRNVLFSCVGKLNVKLFVLNVVQKPAEESKTEKEKPKKMVVKVIWVF